MHILLFASPHGRPGGGLGKGGRLWLGLFLVLGWGGGMVFPGSGAALTWDFAAGSRQGWIAREGAASGISSTQALGLQQVVEEGFWRITPLPYSAFEENRRRAVIIELVSPHIGYDSELFDTVRMRVRIDHPGPVRGSMVVRWTNPTNRDTPGDVSWEHMGKLRFYMVTSGVVFQPTWQEVVVPDIPQAIRAHWQGELIDIRIELHLGWPEGPEDIPARIDIASITLTGFEEQLLAEPLPVPGADLPVLHAGTLFAPAVFHPLLTGIGPVNLFSPSSAALLDANGDG